MMDPELAKAINKNEAQVYVCQDGAPMMANGCYWFEVVGHDEIPDGLVCENCARSLEDHGLDDPRNSVVAEFVGGALDGTMEFIALLPPHGLPCDCCGKPTSVAAIRDGVEWWYNWRADHSNVLEFVKSSPAPG